MEKTYTQEHCNEGSFLTAPNYGCLNKLNLEIKWILPSYIDSEWFISVYRIVILQSNKFEMSSHANQVQWTSQNLNTEYKAWTQNKNYLINFKSLEFSLFLPVHIRPSLPRAFRVFMQLFPLTAYATDTKSKHKFIPNLLMIGNKHSISFP